MQITNRYFSNYDKMYYVITAKHLINDYIMYHVKPDPDFYIFKEFEYKYPELLYREDQIKRLISIGEWIQCQIAS